MSNSKATEYPWYVHIRNISSSHSLPSLSVKLVGCWTTTARIFTSNGARSSRKSPKRCMPASSTTGLGSLTANLKLEVVDAAHLLNVDLFRVGEELLDKSTSTKSNTFE